MSSPAAVAKKIEQIETQLGKLKMMLTEKSAGKSKTLARKRKDKPETIEKCTKKSDLEKFTVKELKEWVKSNGVDTKKLTKKHKEDFVKLVWKKLKETEASSSDESSSDSSESSSSGSDSGSSSSDSDA